MIDHVERWRQAGEWTSRFPDQFIDRNKRLTLEFWFNYDNSPGPGLQEVLAAGVDKYQFMAFHLPHTVPFTMTGEQRLPEPWLREHLSGAWTFFTIGPQRTMFFEHSHDAVHFKLVHYDGR